MAIQTTVKNQLIHVGDLIQVYTRLVEGDKTRTHLFEGIVIAIKGREENKTFTVRRIASAQIGVERIWPVNSPWIEKIKVKKAGRVRRSKLYFLRDRKGKAALKVKPRLEKSKKKEKTIAKKAPGTKRRKPSKETSSK